MLLLLPPLYQRAPGRGGVGDEGGQLGRGGLALVSRGGQVVGVAVVELACVHAPPVLGLVDLVGVHGAGGGGGDGFRWVRGDG